MDRRQRQLRAAGWPDVAVADRHRYHYIKAKVKVCRHTDGTVSVFHDPRRLAKYDEHG